MFKFSHVLGAMLLTLSLTAQSSEPEAFEVVIAKPKADVSINEFLSIDKKMETQFVSKQKGFISREVAVNPMGEVFAIVHWNTLKDAEAAAAAFMSHPVAKERNDKGELILFRHYVKQ